MKEKVLIKKDEAHNLEWSASASVLIEWYKKYLNYLSKNRKPEVRNFNYYRQIDRWIMDGPFGAKSYYVIETLSSIKQHIEWLGINV